MALSTVLVDDSDLFAQPVQVLQCELLAQIRQHTQHLVLRVWRFEREAGQQQANRFLALYLSHDNRQKCLEAIPRPCTLIVEPVLLDDPKNFSGLGPGAGLVVW